MMLHGWWHMYTSFQSASTDLCGSFTAVAQWIAVSYVDPDSLSPLLACHLIALDKNSGMHMCSISIGETSLIISHFIPGKRRHF